VNGGMRRIVNVLVDAGATALDFVDPPEEQSAVTPPAIRAKVDNKKFVGAVEVFYDRAADTYGILLTLTSAGEERVITDVQFDELGMLQVCLGDETWMQAKVTMLKPAGKPKVAAPA
jgi:hypothetical protein